MGKNKSDMPFDQGYNRAADVLAKTLSKYDKEALESGDPEEYWQGFNSYLADMADTTWN